jgi:hypothetical protein
MLRTNPDYLFNLALFISIAALEAVLLIGIYYVLA